jgi:hypothetical protein
MIKATAALAPGRGGGWGPVPLAPPSRTPRRNPSCSGPPPRPARRSRRKPRPGKKPSEKSRLFLTLGRSTAASRVFFYLGHVRLLPQALRGVHGRRCLEPSQCSCCTAGEGRSGRKRQVLGRRKNQETRFAMRGAGVTYLPGRTRRRRAASRPRAQRWRARRRRPHEPSGQSARRGGLADAAANTRKAREEMEEQEPGLSAPKPSLCPLPQELVSPVWWVGLKRKPGGASRRGLAAAGALLPYPCYGHVPRIHVASIGCSDRAGRALLLRRRGQRRMWGPAIQRRGWSGPGISRLGGERAPSGRPLASLTSQTAGGQSRWTILQLCHSLDSFSLFRLGNGRD